MSVQNLPRVFPWQDESTEEHRNRFYGEYMGFVRDRDDPEKRGRVRCYVPALINSDREDSWTDWAEPKTSGLSVPPDGAPVWVTFELGQPQAPVYQWGWVLGSDPESSTAPDAGKGIDDGTWLDEVQTSTIGAGAPISALIEKDSAKEDFPEYPFNKVYKTESGQIIELDDTPTRPRARYYHPTGTTILINSDGSVRVKCEAFTVEPSADYIISLGQGASFKVLYPNGGGLAIGPGGFHIRGFNVTILGRTVTPAGSNI